MSIGMQLWRYAANISTPREAGQVPLPEFPQTITWLHKEDMTMTRGGGGWLTGRMTGAVRLRGEDGGKELKTMAGATDTGQTMCAFSRRNSVRMGVSRSWAHGFCHFLHKDKFASIV